MPDDFPKIDYLTDSPEGELNYKPDNTGVERVSNKETLNGPSLEGPIPRYGHKDQKGLAGTMVSDELSQSVQGKAPEHGPNVGDVHLTPEAMLAASKRMEDELLAQQTTLDGSTAVDPALIRTRSGTDVPDWLQQYMATQAPTDPYHFQGMNPVDRIKSNKYLTEQEKLRMLRDQQRSQGLK